MSITFPASARHSISYTHRRRRAGYTRCANAASRLRTDGRCSCSKAPQRLPASSGATMRGCKSCEPPSTARYVSSLNAVEQLLLPAECLLCHGLLGGRDTQRLVCSVCRQRWRPVRPPWCERCAQPEPHFGPCRLCSDWPAALQSVRSAFWLSEGARAAVHALKYGGLPRIADDMAAGRGPLLESAIGSAGPVPIPLAPQLMRQRGYKQSDALAPALGRGGKRPALPPLLARTPRTP